MGVANSVMRGNLLLCKLKWDQNKCPLYGVAGCVRSSGVSNVLKSMEIRSGLSELSIISQVSAVEECPLSGFHCSFSQLECCNTVLACINFCTHVHVQGCSFVFFTEVLSC